MRHFTNILVLMAFALAGLSPACKFVSGQKLTTFQEICTLAGIKLIPADGQPASDHPSKPSSLADCVFCFARDHSKAMQADDFILSAPLYIALRDAPQIDPTTISLSFLSSFQARAPPV